MVSWKKFPGILPTFFLLTIIALTLSAVSLYYRAHPLRPYTRDLPILVTADAYAKAVADQSYEEARAYGTEENARQLREKVFPRFQAIARRHGMKELRFKKVVFEKSLLVRESLDHQIVAEKMVYDTPTKKNRVLYLRFEIVKKDKGFLVLNTQVIELEEKS